MLSSTVEYALRAMSWLALTPDQLVPTSTLAKHTQVPVHYLAKVLQQLAAARLITGRRGVGGGYRLARQPSQITLIQVVNAVSPVERITTCPLGLSTHGSQLCSLHRRMDAAAKAIIDILDGVTLQDLIDDPGRRTPLCETAPVARLTISAGKA